MPFVLVRLCLLCFGIQQGRCVRCGATECGDCGRCYGCGQILCEACESPGTPSYSYPGDQYMHPHRMM